MQQRNREVAEEEARRAARSGDAYQELVAEGIRHCSKQDWRKAGKAIREAIALRPDEPAAYYNLGAVLADSGHFVESAQRYLQAKGAIRWARGTGQRPRQVPSICCGWRSAPRWPSQSGGTTRGSRRCRRGW